jgi:hypothetical protein
MTNEGMLADELASLLFALAIIDFRSFYDSTRGQTKMLRKLLPYA